MPAIVAFSSSGPRSFFGTPGTTSGCSSAYWNTSFSRPGVCGPSPVKP